MEFIKEITILENTLTRKEEFITTLGNSTVLLTALDTLDIYNPDGTIVVAPRFLKAITRYVAAYIDSSYFIKLRNPANDNLQDLTSYIEDNYLKLILDINAPKSACQNIRIVTLTNVDKTILNELTEAFQEHNLPNVDTLNCPTTTMSVDVIKIELPEEYRDIENPQTLEKVCEALVDFIKMYINITD